MTHAGAMHPTHCSQCGARLARDNATGRCAPCQASSRDRVAHAPNVLPEFWHHPAIQAALAARHMGRLIRAYRRHPYHGRHPIAQEIVAGWVGLTQTQLSRIETGPPLVHLDRLTHWAEVLHIPASYLWFALPTGPSSGAASGSEEVNRRDFLGVTGAAVTATLVPSAAVASSPPAPQVPAVRDLSAVMLAPAGTAVSQPVPVLQLAGQVVTAWRLRQRAHYDALGQLLPTLLRDAQTTAADADTADQEQASRVVVHAYNAASSLLRKLGDESLALLAADRAVRAAQALGDPVLTAAALYRLANVLLSAQRLNDTKAVALQAADLTAPGQVQTPRSLALWGGLLLTAAVAAARHGDESDAWELMGEARAASRLLQIDHADIYSIFGPTNVAIHGVQVAVELRNGRDAVRRSHHVDADQLPASLVERRGQFLIDVATGHILQGEDGAATTTLLRADDIAPQEVRLSPEVHGLVRTMLRRERAGAVSGLRPLAGRIGLTD